MLRRDIIISICKSSSNEVRIIQWVIGEITAINVLILVNMISSVSIDIPLNINCEWLIIVTVVYYRIYKLKISIIFVNIIY